MGTKCSGCKDMIYDLSIMECCQCKKVYHYKCLSMTTERFDNFTQEEKDNWVCPDCVRRVPRGDNTDTPIRGSTPLNQTFTPILSTYEYVNKKRGGGGVGGAGTKCADPDDSVLGVDKKLLDELREFRREMEFRMDSQKKEYEMLESRFGRTEAELCEIKKILRVFEEKANKVDELERLNSDLIKRNQQLETSLTMASPATSQLSFANVAKKNIPINTEANKQSVAMKQASGPQPASESVTESRTSAVQQGCINTEADHLRIPVRAEIEKDSWTVVKKKQRRYPATEVKKGGNKSEGGIQGMEKKKFLHVWRLKKETTIDNLQKHIESVLGEGIPVKIEAIKHKTERDYASFIIGVPESQYDKICHQDCWAVNIEFCEWFWFRPSTGNP